MPGLGSQRCPSLSSTPGLISEATEQPRGTPSPEVDLDQADDSAWRGELAARLSRYRARHKMRPLRYPSLRLPFDRFEAVLPSKPQSHSPSFAPMSEHALALAGGERGAPGVAAEPHHDDHPETAARSAVPNRSAATNPAPAHPGAKIIEFPRFAWAPPEPPPDQLAEPVSDRPRILDVPEVAPAPPALGGISIEPVEKGDPEKRPGIDVPLQSASLSRRIFASLLDGAIVTVAGALFASIFWKITAIRPPQMQVLELACGIPCLFWFAYQYLLIVYAGRTPGLRAAGLELAHFDGTPTRRSLRRWRVLASYLSAASLGMGYAWVFLDEDTLCWHDRITHTYLAPRKTANDESSRQRNR
jgi:uncharacterized RDD family membrane protein YckC